ncbi:MAG TPA: hypothetical protein VFZ93_04830 [Albitalea sp.]
MGQIKFSALVATALLAVAPLAAQAGSYDGNTVMSKCAGVTVGPLLNAVETAIASAWVQNERDRTNLQSKLATANSKTLAQPTPKWDDANTKLEDISNTATALANAAKPKLNDGGAINSAVLAAQACIY